ncbi:MAG: BatD family protein [Gammaproteobacteria bacterium]|nr:BatD family protein [Gammaproteobacteria bacterium]MDH3415712.1 BatD family protein [Gammaproteobacteria bacterium]
MVKTAGKVILIAIAAVSMCGEAFATVVTRVDRADIELNESFTLEVIADTNIEMQPDVSVLDEDFYVGQGSQLSNTTIVNGQIRRSKTWTFVLMPRKAGQLTIPSISIGNERSDPLTITVSEPSYAPPGEADVFVTSEVDFDETYVQAQVLLTVKIYRAVATRQPALREPVISGVETLSELAGDDRSYEAIIDGTAYQVVERVYALYPQESGEIEISPARFEARVLRDGRITGRKMYESEPQSVTVLPVPAPPADYADAVWLPARSLQLFEDWSAQTDEIQAGEPLTRHVTTSVLGQLETQIPALDPPSVAGINIYPDKPELSRRIESGGIRGVRKDQYALIATGEGSVVLPALEVPWWNIATGDWQVARLPERSINILPSGEPAAPEPAAAATVAAEKNSESVTTTTAPDRFWRSTSELLAAVWLVTLLAWWWSSRPKRQPKKAAPTPVHKLQARQLRAARKAAVTGDSAGVRQAMISWGLLQWPDDAPRSIGVIAQRVSSPLADELRKLSSLSYGPQSGEWDGEALARAIRSFSVLKDEPVEKGEFLPPLMPTP